MSLQFTSLIAINTRLHQRLQMGGTQAAFGRSVIPDLESTQIAEQVEGRIRIRLRERYTFPLKLTDKDAVLALASIVEKLTICDILAPAFAGVDPSGEGGYIRNEFCMQGEKELKQLLDSFIKGENPIGISSNSQTRSPVVGKRSGGVMIEF